MSEVTFYSYKPFLQVSLKDVGLSFNFGRECRCVVTGEKVINAMREYVNRTRSSYILTEEGSGMDLCDLQRLHEESEVKLIQEAEERVNEELMRREKHELFSLLRM